MIAASFLGIKNDIRTNILKLDQTNIDYLHLDIMDGIFVNNTSYSINELKEILKETTKPKDIHLMVKDVKKYVDECLSFKPEYITFHVEVDNPLDLINYIKSKGIKVGLAIKPETKVEDLYQYLDMIDLILVMTVEPGYGSQAFIPEMINKVNELRRLQGYHNYLIAVDGGINDETIKQVKADIYVVGSYITSSDNYQEQVDKLKLNQ